MQAPNPVDLVILDDNLGMIKLLCTRKHDSSQRVSSCNHFALHVVHMKSKISDVSDQHGHQAHANSALVLDTVFNKHVYRFRPFDTLISVPEQALYTTA